MTIQELHNRLDQAIKEVEQIKKNKDKYKSLYGENSELIIAGDIDSVLCELNFDIKWALRELGENK